jgi:hypothetical protein
MLLHWQEGGKYIEYSRNSLGLFVSSCRQNFFGGFILKRSINNEIRKIYNINFGIAVGCVRRARDKAVPAGLVRGMAEQIGSAV